MLEAGRSSGEERLRAFYLAGCFFAAHQCVELLVALAAHHDFWQTCHWDCPRYVTISHFGYPTSMTASDHMENWAFFPLFPLLVHLAYTVLPLSWETAAVLTGKLLFFGAIYAFIQFVKAYDTSIAPLYAAFVVALNPYTVYGNSGYTEPLYLLLVCVFFIFLQQRKYLACGIAGALLSATRVPGILVMLPYALVVAQQFRQADTERRMEMLIGGLLIPAGLAMFMLHLYGAMGDALAFAHVQKAWGRSTGNPLAVIAKGIGEGTIHLDWALMSVAALAGAVFLMLTQRMALGVFSLCSTLVPLSSGLQSMPRYIWWQAPLLLVVASGMQWKPARYIFVPVFMAGLVYFYVAWMAGKSWTV